jgi:thioester reductase-like protein
MTAQFKPFSDLFALATGNPSRLAMSWNHGQVAPMKSRMPKSVLVTGANGFVGLHLVRELAARAEVSRIHALVRANTDGDALNRLLVAARRFGLTISNQEKLRVHGTSFSSSARSPLMDQLAEELDAVIHSAGSTSHVRPYLYYRKESVLPLAGLMQFARTGQQKSLHIMGSVGADIFVRLQDFFKVNFFYCGYSRMKWITKHLTQIAYDRGLSITIYLPSYVIGSSCTGYRDPGMRYSFWQMLRLCNDLNMIWDSGDDAIAVVTGEDLSRRIVKNVLEPAAGACVYPSSCVSTRDLASRFQWDHVPWPTFYQRLRKRYRLLQRNSASSFQNRLIARLLFPSNLPELVHRTSRSVDMASVPPEAMAATADTILACAKRNYLFNRKQRSFMCTS